METPGYSGSYDGLRIYQTQLANLKLTQSSFVGYSRVKVYETGNGYTLKEYTSAADYPNTDAIVSLPSNPHNRAVLRINNGTFPDMMTDADLFRGSLKEEAVYNQAGHYVARTINTYQHKRYTSVPISNSVINSRGLDAAEGCDYAPVFMSESASIHIERNLLKETQSISYHLDGSQISTTTAYAYEDNYPFVSEKNVANSTGSTYKTRYHYPYSNPQFDIQYTTGPKPAALPCEGESDIRLPLLELTQNNKIATPFYVKEYKDRNLVSNQLLLYKTYQYTPKEGMPPRLIAGGIPIVESSISNTREILTKASQWSNDYHCTLDKDLTAYQIHLYDDHANPIEVSSSADAAHTVLIWGYQGSQLLAKIENATFDDVSGSTLLEIISKSNADDDSTFGDAGNEGQLRVALAKLRNPAYFPNLVNAQITTYTYDPLIGITSMTDARGETLYYTYGTFNRLEYIKDTQGNILSKNQYHYKN
ncbi:MAG: hypothetical protein GKR88_05810 [Flavobacteriaceae bacterium]|nr:MAG: hypothetical protein GKR88_05810 [Flavobacteriaceae bacterium]